MQRIRTIIYNELSAWCREGAISKSDIKEISVELEIKLKKQRKASPLFNPMNELFQRYADKYEKEIIWTSRTGKSMNELIGKISILVAKKNPQFTNEDILNSFELILQNLPEFYLNSYDLITINSKIDSIINTIKSDRKKQHPINTEAVADMLRNSRIGDINHK